jgi:hypothetical protein
MILYKESLKLRFNLFALKAKPKSIETNIFRTLCVRSKWSAYYAHAEIIVRHHLGQKQHSRESQLRAQVVLSQPL